VVAMPTIALCLRPVLERIARRLQRRQAVLQA
jgi:hypothetical protein